MFTQKNNLPRTREHGRALYYATRRARRLALFLFSVAVMSIGPSLILGQRPALFFIGTSALCVVAGMACVARLVLLRNGWLLPSLSR